MLVVNCKNYMEMAGSRLDQLMQNAQAASRRYGIDIAVAPPHHRLGMPAAAPVMVLAQHVDTASPGSTTGFVVPEMLKSAGVSGSIINHSERRIGAGEVAATITRLRDLGMISVVCTRDAEETGRYASMGPDYVAVEPPELIGTGRSVSTERPGLINEAAEAVREAGTRTKLLCGAGIVTGHDVAKAMSLGSSGILVASGVVKADDPGRVLDELAKASSSPPPPSVNN